MAVMWILLWLHVEAGMKTEAFQLGSFGSYDECVEVAKQAQIMEVDRTIIVKCIEIRVGKLK
jgi:hypothetical protein